MSLFQEETPSMGPDDRYAGIRAMWIKVVIRAIFDWIGGRDHKKLEKRKEAEQAYNWIFKPSIMFNSFDNACRYVDLDPGEVRKRILSMSKEDVAKIEYLERYQMPDELEEIIKTMKPPSKARKISASKEVALHY